MTRKIVLGIFLLAIIFFLLPWVNISCAGTHVITISGLDMVTGSYDITDVEKFNDTNAESEPLAIWTLVAAGVGLIASLFVWKIGFVIRILSGLAGIGLLIALKIKLGNDIANQIGNEMEGIIQINYLAGYWLTMTAFAAASIVSAIKKQYTIKIIETPESPTKGSGPPIDKPPSDGSIS